MTDRVIHMAGKEHRGSAEVWPSIGTQDSLPASDLVWRIRSAEREPMHDGSEPSRGIAAAYPMSTAHGASFPFFSRFVVLQAIGAAGIAGLWIAGIAAKPFESDSAFLCWVIVGLAALGIVCVSLQRWRDVQWLATHIVRLGLLGTVIGLIIAFSAAKAGGSADPSEVGPMIAAVVDGMYVSLYATLLGIATNLWLKINLRLLGRIDG